ncbi:MAG: hypothetical protein ACLFTO_00230 [Candidatus Acetothermia bacterium]
MAEAVALYSGSLSSSVATELAVNHSSLDRVIVLTLRSPFFAKFDRVKELAETLWPGTRFRSKSIKKKTGRIGGFERPGSNDRKTYCSKCQAILLETGRDFLDGIGADFLVSGEMIGPGENTPPQKLDGIDRKVGLEGRVYRPLSSAGLPQTVPEKNGWMPGKDELTEVKLRRIRDDLERRKRGEDQGFLAAEDRCKLTRGRYRRRLKDLLREEEFNVNDISLLDFENYYKIPPDTKVVLGKGPEGKRRLHNYFLPQDLRFYLPTREGPMALVRSGLKGEANGEGREVVKLAARITAGGCEEVEDGKVEVNYRFEHQDETYRLMVSPMDEERLCEYRL